MRYDLASTSTSTSTIVYTASNVFFTTGLINHLNVILIIEISVFIIDILSVTPNFSR